VAIVLTIFKAISYLNHPIYWLIPDIFLSLPRKKRKMYEASCFFFDFHVVRDNVYI